MTAPQIYARLIKYFDRGRIHFGNFQMPLTIIIALGVYKETTIGRWIFAYSTITIPAIVILFVGTLVVVGRMEYKLGLIKRQQQIDNENNPMLNEILKLLKEKK